LLEYLDELGIRPGARVEVLARNYDDTITLQVDSRTVPLGRAAAARIWVELASVSEEA
jgi:Fe2+ transport system protein FeoA